MNPDDNLEEAIQLLQLLGLNEYEARCYVGLTRIDAPTSRELSEVADIPRTQVYDAIRVLEAQGLVEVKHSSPNRFRAVPIEEALDRIRNRYKARFDELQEALNTIAPVESTDDDHPLQSWSVTGREATESRAIQLVKAASAEVVLALGDESLLTEPFVEALTEVEENVELVIYTPTEAMSDRIRGIVPTDTTVLPRLERLYRPTTTRGRSALARILLIDQSAALVSSIDPDTGGEQAVFSQGPKTPLVTLTCQIICNNGLLIAPESKA